MGAEQSYQCAQHHSHKSMEDVKQCNDYHNNRGGEGYTERMTDKFINAHERGAIDSSTLNNALKGTSSNQKSIGN